MTNDAFISSTADALGRVGLPLGVTEWHRVEQTAVDTFAAVTGDEQWLHTDPEKAREGPFGACIAHGLFTLGLAGGKFFHETVRTTARMGVNYGCDRVRYPMPLRVGQRIRGRAEMKAAEALPDNGVQMCVAMTVDIEGEGKPACAAEFIVRYFF
jgi:acyl dehydratase